MIGKAFLGINVREVSHGYVRLVQLVVPHERCSLFIVLAPCDHALFEQNVSGLVQSKPNAGRSLNCCSDVIDIDQRRTYVIAYYPNKVNNWGMDKCADM